MHTSPPGSLQKRSAGQVFRMSCGAKVPHCAPALRSTCNVTSGCLVSCSGMAVQAQVTSTVLTSPDVTVPVGLATVQILPDGCCATVTLYEPFSCRRVGKTKLPSLSTVSWSAPLFTSVTVVPDASPDTAP